MNLGIYLNDHLAGAEAGCQLLARLTRQNPSGHLGRNLRDLLGEIRADKRILQELATRAGAKPPALKRAGGWIVEKAGRLKLSFRSERASSLSLFEGLELLSIGVLGKRAMWQALHLIQEETPVLQRTDFAGLAARAVTQFERLEAYRLLSAPAALLSRDHAGRSGAARNMPATGHDIRSSRPLRLRLRETRATRKGPVNGEKTPRTKARSH